MLETGAATQAPGILAGKVAVVTGGTRGLGLAIATAFATNGASVVVASRTHAAAVGAAQLIDAHTGRSNAAFGVQADVGRRDAVDGLASAAVERHGRFDIWVNNAGVLNDGLIGMTSQASIDKTLAVNLAGVLHGIQQAAQIGRAHV